MNSAGTAPEINQVVIGHLETLLADSYALMAQTHLAHWNVEGANFFGLHTAFQTQYEELFTAIDEIAERIRALGGYSPGGLAMLDQMSEIGGMERKLDSNGYLTHLAKSHQILIDSAAKGRDAAGGAGDAETEDLFIARLQVHEKTLWMLKSALS